MWLNTRAENSSVTKIPSPYSWQPTGSFSGNDGKWSSYYVNVGDIDGSGNGENFEVLISLSSPLTLLPAQADWCNSDCAAARGVQIYNSKQPSGAAFTSSQGWNEHGLYNVPLPYWWSDDSINGTYGTINIGLDQSSTTSPILQGNTAVEYTDSALFMGSFGLAIGDVNPGGGGITPFLTNFASFNNTPSLSYGYTAGAYYQNNNKGSLGSLVLGGYDESRVGTQRVSIGMPQKGNTTLLVGVQSITYKPDADADANEYSFTSSDNTGFYAAIDSTLPYLELPDNICDQFADKFQLTYDDKRSMYTVNSSSHDYNTKQNATVNFKIGADQSNSNDYATVSLPYSAFDLQASYPIFENATDYFPLKKSTNGIFVLGRAFLQEAYVVVDYERQNFTVAQALPATSSTSIKPILSTIYASPGVQSSSSSVPNNSDKKLSGGAIAGIVVGTLAAVGLLALGAFFLWKRQRKSSRAELPSDKASGEIDTMQAAEQEYKRRHMSELDSEGATSPKPSFGGYYENKDGQIRTINEMESPPAELYSPPQGSVATPASEGGRDYFLAGGRMRRRGATRESSGNNTPGTPNHPIAELPGDTGTFLVDGQPFEKVASPPVSPLSSPAQHSRDPSDTSLPSNIDEVLSGAKRQSEQHLETQHEESPAHPESESIERRPSHTRGLSDTTVHSDTTAVSQPTPEELENWALGSDEPRRPLSE